MKLFLRYLKCRLGLLLLFAAFAGILLLLLIPTLFISKVDPARTVKAE